MPSRDDIVPGMHMTGADYPVDDHSCRDMIRKGMFMTSDPVLTKAAPAPSPSLDDIGAMLASVRKRLDKLKRDLKT